MTRGRAEKSRTELVAALQAAAPPGLGSLDPTTLDRLAGITAELVANPADGVTGAERFERQSLRTLGPDHGLLRTEIEGRVVLVTGGTGCIGSALLRELLGLGAKRLVSLSRGGTATCETASRRSITSMAISEMQSRLVACSSSWHRTSCFTLLRSVTQALLKERYANRWIPIFSVPVTCFRQVAPLAWVRLSTPRRARHSGRSHRMCMPPVRKSGNFSPSRLLKIATCASP